MQVYHNISNHLQQRPVIRQDSRHVELVNPESREVRKHCCAQKMEHLKKLGEIVAVCFLVPIAGAFGKVSQCHQTFQVPKMEVLSLKRLFWGWVFPYISLTYCLYR